MQSFGKIAWASSVDVPSLAQLARGEREPVAIGKMCASRVGAGDQIIISSSLLSIANCSLK